MTADRPLQSFDFEKPDLEETEEIYWEKEKKFVIINHAKQILYRPDHTMNAEPELFAKERYWDYVEKHPAHLQDAAGGRRRILNYLIDARDEALSYLNWCSLGRTGYSVKLTC
jgi:hypothetical protein